MSMILLLLQGNISVIDSLLLYNIKSPCSDGDVLKMISFKNYLELVKTNKEQDRNAIIRKIVKSVAILAFTFQAHIKLFNQSCWI